MPSASFEACTEFRTHLSGRGIICQIYGVHEKGLLWVSVQICYWLNKQRLPKLAKGLSLVWAGAECLALTAPRVVVMTTCVSQAQIDPACMSRPPCCVLSQDKNKRFTNRSPEPFAKVANSPGYVSHLSDYISFTFFFLREHTKC
jgi:hypothetical protein